LQEQLANDRGLPEDPPSPYHHLPFDRAALFVYRLGFWLAPSWWLIDTSKRYRSGLTNETPQARFERTVKEELETAGYVTFWFVVLLAIWLASPSGALAAVAGGVALFRLMEIVISVLGFVLDQREPKIARSLVTIGVLAVQVVLIFAIIDHSFAGASFVKPSAQMAPGSSSHATSPVEFLYLSWTYMTTVGNQYTAKTELARILQLAGSISGILLLGIVAARAIGLTFETKKLTEGMDRRVSALEKRAGDPPPDRPSRPT
jgi:hypothetical protein